MSSPSNVLILQNDRALQTDLARIFKGDGWKIRTAKIGEARHSLACNIPDCAILALKEVDVGDVKAIMEVLHASDDNLPVIALARDASLEVAVSVMKAGLYDFVTYPLDKERLKNSVEKAIHLYDLTKRVFLLESQVGWLGGLDEMVGHSSKMQEVFQMIQMVAKTGATVLVLGESGTGKELVAKALHRLSPRNKRVFIDINCGAIPRELLENELFGHERGAYTGADRQYIGSCERADGGTLFLDEISEMDPALQVKILRFLQERSFMRVGGTANISVDVRVIAATNCNLEEEVSAGRFREDLFYRLNVVPIKLPSLRDHRGDIPVLAKHFLEKYTTRHERVFVDFEAQAMEAMVGYDWPGNVRELENIIERVTVLQNDSSVKLKHLPSFIQEARGAGKAIEMPSFAADTLNSHKIVPLDMVEKYAIEAALARCSGNVVEAAKKLKISQATMYRKIKQYGLK